MTRRPSASAMAASVVGLLAVAVLAGCSALTVKGFDQSDAKAEVVAWTTESVRAAGGSSASETKADGFLTCRSDTGFLTTTYEWRRITQVQVPLARQAAATAAITDAFAADHWTATTKRGITSVAGPKGGKHNGLITIQTAGSTQLSISAISACYK